MTKLASLLQNGAAIRDGRWIKPGGKFGDLEIQTRGYNDAFADDNNRRLGDLNKLFSESGQVPTAERRAALQNSWAECCFLDIRGIENEDGSAVTKAQFLVAMRSPGGGDLWAMAQNATGAVHTFRDVIEKEVEGNSVAP